jgi:hypothetical protein
MGKLLRQFRVCAFARYASDAHARGQILLVLDVLEAVFADVRRRRITGCDARNLCHVGVDYAHGQLER